MTINLPASVVVRLELAAERAGTTVDVLIDRFTRRLSSRDLARIKKLGRSRASSLVARNKARARGDCTTCRKRPAEPGKCRCVECNAARKSKSATRRERRVV